MRLIKLTIVCLAVLTFFIVAAPANCAASTANEVYVCKFHDGKSMPDLLAVIEEWKAVIKTMDGGDTYSASILMPIASDDLSSIVWVGEAPDAATLGSLADQYATNDSGREVNAKFGEVITCQSRSLWRVHKVK